MLGVDEIFLIICCGGTLVIAVILVMNMQIYVEIFEIVDLKKCQLPPC